MMSQKYKHFVKGSDFALPPTVKRFGYLKKLKKMKRRFFVLHMESECGDARLEYYSSEKKWRAGGEPRRSISLKSCLNIGRKLHSKQKNVIALYTQDDCFSVVTETPDDLELWLADMLEVQRTYLAADENKYRPVFEHLWQVEIDKHDLECSRSLSGPYRVALSSKSLTLIQMNPANDFHYLEFPLMSIRRCGHSKDHFFIELGRSAITGAGEIYMATEGTIIAQNMHETVLSAMKSSKVREDGGNVPPRPRSASTSDHSTHPLVVRRPVGVVLPQQMSDSRERCDSLPKTLQEKPHNCLINGISYRRICSRPHSMYEWPSFSSPTTRITSTFSFSSNGGSSEEVDSVKQSASFLESVDPLLREVPDEYLMMSPEGSKSGYVLMKQPHNTPKSSPVAVKEDAPDGYLDMSPSTQSYLQNFNDIHSLERSRNKAPSKMEQNEDFVLEKVPSLLKACEEDKRKMEPPLFWSGLVEENNNRSPLTDVRTRCHEIPFPNEPLPLRPPVPKRTYRHQAAPPLPPHKGATVAPHHPDLLTPRPPVVGDYVNLDFQKVGSSHHNNHKSVPPPMSINDSNNYSNVRVGSKPLCPIPKHSACEAVPFRKQLSAPASSPLRPDLPSPPARKSSCPVRPPRSSSSPDHNSSASSVSSTSDDSSAPFGKCRDYENVPIARELNYASLDLAPCSPAPPPRSPPHDHHSTTSAVSSAYAQIDFTKSEGLKNISRDGGRL